MTTKKAFALRLDEKMMKAVENGLLMNLEVPMGN